MKNIPKKIYLQIGEADVTSDRSIDDFNDLFYGAITWSDDKINDNDLEYILASEAESQRREWLFELRQMYIVNIGDDGQPKASIEEIMELWDKVNNFLNQ